MEKSENHEYTMHHSAGWMDFDGDSSVIERIYNEATNHLIGAWGHAVMGINGGVGINAVSRPWSYLNHPQI